MTEERKNALRAWAAFDWVAHNWTSAAYSSALEAADRLRIELGGFSDEDNAVIDAERRSYDEVPV